MDDNRIIELLFLRDESSIKLLQEKYGSYALKIADNILSSREDSAECVSDLMLKLWNSIPPERPNNLSFYIGKITRNLAFDKLKKEKALKRGKGEGYILLSELQDCVPEKNDLQREIEGKEFTKILNCFLDTLSFKNRKIFLLRYYYAYSIKDISEKCAQSEGSVKASLFRTRNKLRKYLESEGVFI